MASKSTFLLLALAFAVVLLIISEVAAAKELASNHDGEVDDFGGYNGGGRGGYNNGGGGYNNGGGRYGGCRYGCCGGGRYYNGGDCRCCSSFAEATAYKQTQN
ncbi:putative glycine rich protein [Helianthus debilis subsp. tardiflorus]